MLPHFMFHRKRLSLRFLDAKKASRRRNYNRGERCGSKPIKPRQLYKLANRMSDLEIED